MLKKDLRRDALKKRAAIDGMSKKRKNSAIRERLFSLPEFKDAKNVLLYASFRDEVDTFGIMEECLKAGKRLFLPVVGGDGLTLEIYEADGTASLRAGYMGIPEPPKEEERKREAQEADVLVIPGAAFDERGFRLGYGKACYDRLLSAMKERRPLVGLAYEEQIVGEVPREAHDVRMDMIVTDERTIKCHG